MKKFKFITNMDNATVINSNRSVTYDDPSFLFLILILFFSFCSILCTCYHICIKDVSIESFMNTYCVCLKNEDEEYNIRYDSDSDSDSELSKYEDNDKHDLIINKIPSFSNINLYPIYCSICQAKQLNTVTVDCGHHFCKECITGYMKVGEGCPNCRQSIKNVYEIEVLVFN